jgi:WD40 repeat protein
VPAVVLVLFTGILVAVGGPAATAASAPGDVQLVSVRDDGSEGPVDDTYSDSMSVAISQDGRYVGFDTTKSLDPVDTDPPGSYYDNRDVYVRDLRAPGHTVMISQSDTDRGSDETDWPSPGVGLATQVGPVDGHGDSGAPSLSANGRFVAFQTTADNLPDDDHDTYSDVVVCDRDPDGDGVFDERNQDGTMAYRYVAVGRRNGPYYREYTNDAPSISADGMTVTWLQHSLDNSYATRVVAGHLSLVDGVLTAPSDYLTVAPAEEQDGATETSGAPPKVSADGRQVAFVVHLCGVSCMTSLAHKPLLSLDGAREGNDQTVVEVSDLTNHHTVRMDYDADGELHTSGTVYDPAISGDGRIVVYQGQPDYSETEDNLVPAIYAVDRDPDGDGVLGPGGGEPIRSTVASPHNDGSPGYAFGPTVSTDGRYVAYSTTDQDMHDGVTPSGSQSSEGPPAELVARDLVVDRERAVAHQPQLPGALVSVSVAPDCLPASCGGNGSVYSPALSGDGRVVAFDSRSTDLLGQPLECCPDRVFARTFRPFAQADQTDFGLVPLGSSLTRTITVRHNGFGPLPITAVSVAGADFAVFPTQTCVDATLYEMGSCLVSVRFTPSALAARTAVLRIEAAGSPPTLVPLTGAGGGVASGFVATPNPLVFTSIKPALSPTAAARVTIANRGPLPWNVGTVRVLGGPHLNPGDFKITSNTCGSLLPGRTCTVSVVATGHGAGLTQAVLSVADTSVGSPHLVGLAFTTVVPVVQVSPAALPSGRVAVVTGQGFPVNHDVKVARADATAVTVHTSAMGTFSVPLVVFDHALVGSAPVTVTSPGTSLRVEAPLLIVLGTFQPPGFTGRR